MDYRIISLPPFKAASSGADRAFDFSPEGILGKFDKYFSAISPSPRDSFMPRDFLYFDTAAGGLVWIYALSEDIDPADNEVVDFPGGLYLTYTYKDGDEQAGAALRQGAIKFLEDTGVLEADISESRPEMGHIITPSEVGVALGYTQMETFLPIRIKKQNMK
ncbi:MAG: hypothetical protein GX061_01905 [Eubacteriaceae bacterium]|nr:hypothetical protein [Eubacteriaceae bacterium]